MFQTFFGLECGLNVCENDWGYSWNNHSNNFEAVWEICLVKCDFTTEIQPRKTDTGTEPVSVSVVRIKKTRKSDIYHIYYVNERSFYKIHASGRFSLNYAFVKSISNFIWSDVICVTIRNANFKQQTENNSDPWLKPDLSRSDIIHTSDSRSITLQLWKDLTKQLSLH